MQPVVCNKDMAVSFPLKDGDCQFWLEIVDSVDDITNPSRDHAYVDSKGLFYIYNGKEIQVINDHANLKIKWGNMIGDISNQLDLMEIINQFVKTISVNGTNIAKDNEKNIAIQVPITTIKLDGNTISPVDYIVNLDLASVYAKKTEIPKNVSELENDAGYIKQEVVDQLIPIKEIKVNNVTILPDENHAVNIENVYITPENFGAVGDGNTDDSTAFNTCFAKAMETGKYVLLSNKTYVINSPLNVITSVNIIGINASIKLLRDIVFTYSMINCNIKGINFYRDEVIQSAFVGTFDSSCLIKCSFRNLFKLFDKVSSHNSKHILLSDCNLHNTILTNVGNEDIETTYIINNTSFNIEHFPYLIYGNFGETIIFNNCDINKNIPDGRGAMFTVHNNIIFNDCNIKAINKSVMFSIQDNDSLNNINISFNNCLVESQGNILIDFTVSKNIYATFKFINTKISANAIAQGRSDLSLWIENCVLNTYYVYVGIGNANIIEIQQKYSDTSQNVFPWISEIPSTYENNVKLIKVGTTDYYVLTESKDKNIKKLDYYFKYDFDYLQNAPYYTNNIIVRDLDLEGYTVKRSLLTNNTCKLKNKSTGDLIDYVYLMLDDNVTVTTTKDTQLTSTSIAMKYLPYFAKLKTDTPITGQCYVDACISIILEKTSS